MENYNDLKNNSNKNSSRKFSYRPKTFRLDKNTVKALESIKKDTNKSYNLIFLDLIAYWQKNSKNKENKKEL